jgi:hypothetical protein
VCRSHAKIRLTLKVRSATYAILVGSMRGDTHSQSIHFLSADLQLNALLAGTDHGCMDRA